jgi:Rap1a immunity proteins
MKARHILAIGMLLLMGAATKAQDIANVGNSMRTGNDLMETCKPPVPGETNDEKLGHLLPNVFCSGYIRGVADVNQAFGLIDIRTATNRQLIDIIWKYLADHPEDRDMSAQSLVGAALVKAFPAKGVGTK